MRTNRTSWTLGRSALGLLVLGLLALPSTPAGAAVLPLHGTLSIAFGSIGTAAMTGSGVGSSAGG